MRYFENPENGQVFAYDETDPSQIPYMEEAINKGLIEVTGNYPTEKMKKDDCKLQAEAFLQQTDWSVLPDVTVGSVKLANQQAFVAYRNQLRELAVNPVVDPVFPTEPQPVWE